MKQSYKKVFIVLGAPRSGTSAICNALHNLNIDFGEPDKFVDPEKFPHNPVFCELQALNKLNDEILAQFGKKWPDSFLPVEDSFYSKKLIVFESKIEDLIAAHFKDRTRIGLKDPRFCYTLPIWKKVLKNLEIDITFILVVRSAQSMIQSNAALVRKRTEWQILNMWIQSNLLAYYFLRNEDFVLANYDKIINNPVNECSILLDKLQCSGSDLEQFVKGFERKLQHHKEKVSFKSSYFVELQKKIIDGTIDPLFYLEYRDIGVLFQGYDYLAVPENKSHAMCKDEDNNLPHVETLQPILKVYVPLKDGYTEEQSYSYCYSANIWNKFDIELTCEYKDRQIRVDPADCFGFIEISEIVITSVDKEFTFLKFKDPDAFSNISVSGTAIKLPHENYLLLFSWRDGAQLYLPSFQTPDEIKSIKVKICMKLHFDFFVLRDHITKLDKIFAQKERFWTALEKELQHTINDKVVHIHNFDGEAGRLNRELRRGVLYSFMHTAPARAKRYAHLTISGLISFRTHGIVKTFVKTRHFFHLRKQESKLASVSGEYEKWIVLNESKIDINLAKKEIRKFLFCPKISIIIPVYNVAGCFLKKAIESVLNQIYSRWELCIVDDASTNSETIETLKLFENNEKVKIKFLQKNLGIAGASNEALDLGTGEFVGFLDHDDELSPDAIYQVVTVLNRNREIDLLYSDEDKISESGVRHQPFFKPDWSPDTLRSVNYICHFTVIRKSLVEKVGGFKSEFTGSQDYDLFLRVCDITGKIHHIPKILYHWRTIDSSVAKNPESKLYAFTKAKFAIKEHLARNNMSAEVLDGPTKGLYRVKYQINGSPEIALIIPTKDRVDTLRTCIDSIIEKTNYENFKIFIVDNGSSEVETINYFNELKENSRISIIKYNQPFNFSAIQNFAVSQINSDTEYIVLLNNDTEIITGDWLQSMLEFAQRPDVGAVGALLYYPDGKVQHGGVILGIGGVAGHSHKYFPKYSMGYFGRLKIIQNLSAVTAACLMTKKSVFEEVGGFDETLSHAFNDVDYCMKLRKKNYYIIYTPYAELYHHESISRGNEDTKEKQIRFQKEVAYFKNKWAAQLEAGDPYYNPNLSLRRENFSLKFE